MLKQAFVLLLFFTSVQVACAQATSDPVEYMRFFITREADLSKKYLDYMSQVAHGNRARKMEKRRQELIAEIRQSLAEANRLRPFKGDATLRDAFKTYWDILYKVFNEDYDKIVDMEEIAEQSYDYMEAYLAAQEKAEEVLNEAHDKIQPAYNEFAKKHHVELIEGSETKLTKQMRQVSQVNSYYHTLFLIFFKSHKQEMYVIDALNRKDLNGLEQNRGTLLRYAQEGLQRLDTIKAFNNDASLVNACRKVLEFHKEEAEEYLPGVNEFLLLSDEFEKTRKAFEAKPANRRTKEDIERYNATVNKYNAALTNSNKLLTTINARREKVVSEWNNTTQRFMDKHVPRAK